jgi:hypothetical protein
MKMLLPRQIVA